MTLSIECAKAVGTTFGTYVTADFLSNFIQHPTQKVRYSEIFEDAKTHDVRNLI